MKEKDKQVMHGNIPKQKPIGLTCVSVNGDVFLDRQGIVWSLEHTSSKMERQLIKHY